MTAPALALWLCVGSAAPEPVTLASTGFNAVRIAPEVVASFSDTFALRLNETGKVKVMTSGDVAAVLGAERQRQLLGCSDAASSCMAELASALGADAIAIGDIAVITGSSYQVMSE